MKTHIIFMKFLRLSTKLNVIVSILIIIPASVDRHIHSVATMLYITLYTFIEQTGLEMLSVWFAGHILSILVKGTLSI